MLYAIKVSLWWLWNVSGHLPTNWCWNISICNGFCRFGCNVHVMVAWCCILDKSQDSDLRGSWLARAVHFLILLLLFAVVEQSWAIMCCILQVLWHSAVFHLCFLHWVWHTGTFFAAIYCQSEPSVSHLVVFYNSLACLVHSLGPEITGPRVFNTIRSVSDTHVFETVAYRNLRIEKHQLKHTIHRSCCKTQCFML